jgi:uncharacterized membrane protein
MKDDRLARLAPWLIVLAAAMLRVVTLSRKSLWLDELVTLQIAGRSPWEILALRSDPHPPLYYLMMHYWLRLGQSELLLRLPSALFGVISVWLMIAFVRQWEGRRQSALVAALLLAVAPMHVWYAQDARMYALVCMWGLASALTYSWALRTGRLLAWGAWIIVTIAGLYTHYSMLLVVLAEMIAWRPLARLDQVRRARPWLFGPALLLAALLYAPQASVFMRQLLIGGGSGSYYITLQMLLAGYGFKVATAQLHTMTLAGGAVLVCGSAALVWLLSARVKINWADRRLLVGLGVLYGVVLLAWAVPRRVG